MKLCLVFVTALAAPAALSQRAPATVRPSLEGRIVRASDKTPIGNALVELIGIEDGRVRSRTQTTKDDGVFRFRDLVAGTAYQIVVSGPGLQPTAHGQSGPLDPWNPITLSPGEQLSGVEITPQLLTAIRGRVLNGKGDPLQFAAVSVMRTAYVAGQKALEQVASTVANMRGEYGFSALPVGVYYLRAVPRNTLTAEVYLTNPAQLDELAADGQSVPTDDPDGYPVSYYPGGSLERAAAIRLGDGTILENMDFRIEEVRTGRLKGTLSGTDSKPIPGKVLLVPERGSVQSNWTRFFQSKDGEFDIRGVLPGSYVLLASGVQSSRDLSARTTVTIGDGESKSVNVALTARPSVRGRITVDDWVGPGQPDLQRLIILLAPSDIPAVDSTLLGPSHEVPSGRAAADAEGNFSINNVPPWSYRVVVASVQQTPGGLAIGPLRGAYLKSVTLNGSDVLTGGFPVETAALENLEITLATTAAALDGRVRTADGEDAAFARVVLVPRNRLRTDLYQAATASNTGQFQFQFLAPGTYDVFAWQALPEGAWLDSEFLKAYENAGTAVEILPDSADQIDLRVIPY